MNHPIYMFSNGIVSSRAKGYRVWITPCRPGGRIVGARGKVWMGELAPEPGIFKLFCSHRVTRDEFDAYYRARLRGAAAQDDIRTLACLSTQRALILIGDCPDSENCYLHYLVRSIQECRDRGDFKLSFAEGRAR